MPASSSYKPVGPRLLVLLGLLLSLLWGVLCGAPLFAQHALAPEAGLSSSSAAELSLPNAPSFRSDAAAPGDADPQAGGEPVHSDAQTKRILGIIPNFRAVSTSEHLPPQSVKEKFTTATSDSFDYSSLFLPATVAAINYSRNNTPEFGSGGVGYSRYLWHTVVDQTIENYMVEFVVPSITHQDTRYYTLGQGGFAKRAGYSLSRIVITRNDAGKEVFNTSEILGAGLGASLSNAYYPSPERTVSNTFTNMSTSIGIDALSFLVKEFWPDINHALFHGDKPFNNKPAH